jgi:hypothetical protein
MDLTILEKSTRIPLFIIHNAAPLDYCSEWNRPRNKTVVYSRPAKRLFLFKPGLDNARAIDVDLDQIASEFPHQTSPLIARLPKSGILEYTVRLTPGAKIAGFSPHHPDSRISLDQQSGRLKWTLPINSAPGSFLPCRIDAKLEHGGTVGVFLFANNPKTRDQ